MKYLIFLSPYFYPEDFPFNKMYFELAKNYKIYVITGMPNYRKKFFYEGYSYFGPYKQNIQNLTIIRMPIFPRLSDNIFIIGLFYFSFLFVGFIFCLIFGLLMRNKIKDVLTFCGSPVFVGYIGNMLSFLSNGTSSLWIQDIWPEAIISSKKINNSIFNRIINFFQNKMWENSDNIMCQSDKLYEYFKKKYPSKNIKILYNPSRNDLIKKKSLKNDKKNNKILNIIYAGNIGLSQNLEMILQSFSCLRFQNYKLFICGDGINKNFLHQKFQSKKIHFLGWLNENDLISILKKSDLALVSLNTIGRQRLILPSKVQTYLQHDIPLLAINSGATNSLVEKYSLGISISKINRNHLIRDLNLQLENFAGKNLFYKKKCHDFYLQNFTLNNVIKQYLNAI